MSLLTFDRYITYGRLDMCDSVDNFEGGFRAVNGWGSGKKTQSDPGPLRRPIVGPMRGFRRKPRGRVNVLLAQAEREKHCDCQFETADRFFCIREFFCICEPLDPAGSRRHLHGRRREPAVRLDALCRPDRRQVPLGTGGDPGGVHDLRPDRDLAGTG